MRSVLILLAITSLAAPAFAAAPDDASKQLRAKQIAEFQARCRLQPQLAVNRGTPSPPTRLTEAPPARMERAVNRLIFGCPVPVIVPNGVEGK